MSCEEYKDGAMEDNVRCENDMVRVEMEPHLSQSKPEKKKRKQNRPRVESDWSSENISKLIKAVEEHRALWDKTLPEYKMPTTLAWQEISDAIGVYKPEECKAKWNNLRVTFNTNLVKLRSTKSGQGSNEKKEVTWKYFKSMMFLEAANNRQSSESVSSVLLSTAITDHSVLADIEMSAASNPVPISGERRRKTSFTKRPTPSPSPSPRTPDSIKFKELAAQALDVISNRAIKDEYSVFGEFIASELRSIPPDRAAFVKRKLNRTLLDLMDEVDSKMLSESTSMKPEFGNNFNSHCEATKLFDDDNTFVTMPNKNRDTPEPIDDILDDESTREAEYPIISPDIVVEETIKQENNSQDAVFLPPPTKRRKTDEYQNEISTQHKNSTDCSEHSFKEQYQNIHSSAEFQSRDELTLFVELVEQRLRKIQNKRNLCILKHDIETLLFNAEIKEYDSSSQLHSPAYSSDT